MKPIYHFECGTPPVLTKKMLAAKMEQRKIRRQMILLSLAGLLLTGYIASTAALLYPINPVLSVACMVYICAAIWGSIAIAIVFTKKRSVQTCIFQQ